MSSSITSGLPEGYFRDSKGKLFRKVKIGGISTIVSVKGDTLNLERPNFTDTIKKKSMVSLTYTNFEGKKVKLKVDPQLYRVIKSVELRVRRGFDSVMIITGASGTGKSTFAFSTLLPALDPSFKQENIFFSADELIEKAPLLPDGSACMLDEGYADMNTRVTGSKKYLKLVNFLSVIRQKRLKIVLILPDFFSLSSHLSIFRSNFLIVTYSDRKTHARGKFLFFDADRKKYLYIKGKKFLNYSAQSANFRGRFYLNKDIIDEKTYIQRKRTHLLDLNKEVEEKLDPNKDRDESILKLKIESGMTDKKIGEIFNLHRVTVSNILNKGRKEKKLNKDNSKQPNNDQDPINKYRIIE
jgi:DNA invertase Pin-like site-specific DNA recombinase